MAHLDYLLCKPHSHVWLKSSSNKDSQERQGTPTQYEDRKKRERSPGHYPCGVGDKNQLSALFHDHNKASASASVLFVFVCVCACVRENRLPANVVVYSVSLLYITSSDDGLNEVCYRCSLPGHLDD